MTSEPVGRDMLERIEALVKDLFGVDPERSRAAREKLLALGGFTKPEIITAMLRAASGPR